MPMNAILRVIDGLEERALATNPVEPDDFELDGLLYCGKCKTPKRKRVMLLGTERIMPCLCQCAAARAQERREAEAAVEERRRIERLKMQGSLLQHCTFEADDDPDAKLSRMCRRYVEKWPEVYALNTGLLFWGDMGTGKTFYAACIVNALIEQGIPARMTRLSRIINDLSGFVTEDKNEYLDELNRLRLLVIDDLGAERQSNFAQAIVLDVIDARYRANMPLIVTTNLSIDDIDAIQAGDDRELARIYDRILEMTTPVKFDGVNRRVQKGNDKKKALIAELGL